MGVQSSRQAVQQHLVGAGEGAQAGSIGEAALADADGLEQPGIPQLPQSQRALEQGPLLLLVRLACQQQQPVMKKLKEKTMIVKKMKMMMNKKGKKKKSKQIV